MRVYSRTGLPGAQCLNYRHRSSSVPLLILLTIGRGTRAITIYFKHMKTDTHARKNTYISVAFLGEYRPLHIEAEDLKQARKEFLSRCHSPEILERFQSVWKSFQADKRAGISIESACSSCCRLSVTIAEHPRDHWLDSVTASMPPHPRLSY